VPAALSVLDGVSGVELEAALARALAELGWDHRPAPTDRYELGVAQHGAEGLLWWEDGDRVVLERHPGGDAGFGFLLTRALSAVTGGLGLAVDALRARDRYGLMAAYAGRPVELALCDPDGVTEHGRPARDGGALCDEERVWARFVAWVEGLEAGAGERLRGATPLGAWLATRARDGAPPADAPLARAWFAGVSADAFAAALGDADAGWRWTAGEPIVLEREQPLDRALVRDLAARLDARMLAIGVDAAPGPFTWARHTPGAAGEDGAGLGAADLINRLVDWRWDARPR
jgi:hypothetical protein